MRFYGLEAKRLLAKQGIADGPHPLPLSLWERGDRKTRVQALSKLG